MHPPFSIVYQITQECPFECDICLRFYNSKSKRLTLSERKKMVDTLSKQGLFRLNITGGEPTILGKELLDFISYAHSKKIHTCLTTTGIHLSENEILSLDSCLDQMIVSFRGENLQEWQQAFGKSRLTAELFEKSVQVLKWVNSTKIILEVSTVLHKQNLDTIINLGYFIESLNSNIVWRIDEYYGIGMKATNRTKFEISDSEFEEAKSHIINVFSHKFRGLNFLSKKRRVTSPEYLITQSGTLVNSSNYTHQSTGLDVMKEILPEQFVSLRPISEFKKVCRDWGWGDY